MKRTINIIFLFITIFSVYNCKQDENSDFDTKGMLYNYSVNMIEPAYKQLDELSRTLKETWISYKNETKNIDDLQTAWTNLFIHWQTVNIYNLGPSGDYIITKSLAHDIGTFPADTDILEEYIELEKAPLINKESNARGIFTLEYLFFADGSKDILTEEKRSKYIDIIMELMLADINYVYTQWSATYSTIFVSNTGNSTSESTSLLFNSFLQSFEFIKNIKLKEPLLKTGDEKLENYVEAFYSNQGIRALKLDIKTIIEVYKGYDNNTQYRRFRFCRLYGLF